MQVKDIEVGSVWLYRPDHRVKAEVVDVNNTDLFITIKFLEHYYRPAINDTSCWPKDMFLVVYLPVYTIEGFEV